ncbi:endonuclease [Pichia kluyveri]|uniref:Endonuclease n=1 Tax=Pichia kluyveri TaxID=36015 RepID=A0AAV5QYH6_PICKL|nr:endonuclease [Pichia kluyveri]
MVNQESNVETSGNMVISDSSQESVMESQYQSQMESQYQSQIGSQLESQLESQVESNGKKKPSIPPLYGVYLLNSVTKKSCFYVGSTPDPCRRLRQHNGELSRGGAYRTKKKGYRPWRMILYVYGFPSKISALQFEHAWQHAYQTRHIPFDRRLNPGKKHTGSGTSIHSKVANCKLLLNSESFKRLGLKVALFNQNIYEIWLKNRYAVFTPIYLELNVKTNTEDLDNESVIKGGNYNQLKEFMESNDKHNNEYLDKCWGLYNDKLKRYCECLICEQDIEVNDSEYTLSVCTTKDCESIYHLKCLSDEFLKQEAELDKESSITTTHILPHKGKCKGCDKVNFWNMIVRGATHLQERLND